MPQTWRYTRARKYAGDDAYSWAVFVVGEQLPRVTGLHRSEVDYYRKQLEARQAERNTPKRE
jgi:hypothetical protein